MAAKTGNYFQKVENMSNEFFKARIDNSGSNYDLLDYVEDNVITIIIIILLVIICFYLYGYISYNYGKGPIELEGGMEPVMRLEDDEILKVENKKIQYPDDPGQFSFTFYLKLDDIYCASSGYWKCLLLKGSPIKEKYTLDGSKCDQFTSDNDLREIENIYDETECKNNYCKDFDNDLSGYAESLTQTFKFDDTFTRIETICNVLKKDEEDGRRRADYLACAMSRCNFIKGGRMSRGNAKAFIDKHREYCLQVYSKHNNNNNNLSRERLYDGDPNSGGRPGSEEDKIYYADEFDNSCNLKNLLTKYPHLIPNINDYINADRKNFIDRTNVEKYNDTIEDDLNYLNTENFRNCWKSILTEYPVQSPGVWLHPYTNDIRIVIRTESDRKFKQEEFNYDHSHVISSFSATNRNEPYYCDKDTNGKCDPYDRNNVGFECDNIGDYGNSGNTFFYNEYFDIKNVPLKEKFHFALIINGSLIEVYINGNLYMSKILYGIPKYINGHLYLNYTVKLSGNMSSINYYPRALSRNEIVSFIAKEPVMVESNEMTSINITKEHQHQQEIKHSHDYNPVKDGEHEHSISKDDISTSFYNED